MENKTLTIEHGLYILAFGLALLLRLLLLGTPPLSEFEAGWALDAYHVATGQAGQLAPQPGYSMLTGLLFFVLGSADALARLLPALVGSALVWLPFCFREKLGQKAALVLAFLLAFDPGMIAVSRLAGGPILALGFGAFALAAGLLGAPVLAGILAGLALLSGPAFLHGLLLVAITGLLARLLGLWGRDGRTFQLPAKATRQFALASVITLVLGATLFMTVPSGLATFGGTFPAYLRGWFSISEVPAEQLLLALVVYQPLGVIFGLIALVRAWLEDDTTGKILSLVFGVALVLGLLYPARQVYDLVWVLLPLLALAAREIGHVLVVEGDRETWLPALGLALLIFVLLVFIWMDFANLLYQIPGTQVYTLRLVVAGAVVLVGIIATVLIGIGWARAAANYGLAWGTLVFLGLYLISVGWGTTRNTERLAQELWNPGPITGERALLMETLGDISEWAVGTRNDAEVVYNFDSDALRWALRMLPNARYADYVSGGEAPAIVITGLGTEQALPDSSYRGQSFAWLVYPYRLELSAHDWIYWFFFREAPTVSDQIILWGRLDVFPEGVESTSFSQTGE
ncbi:MAG: hypothetical protein JXB38_03980 [Anaerolineales bacterium]|nr:hypothetical protein [Anaerolineales bacterium]